MLIDTHCHLDFKEFDLDRPEVIKRARENDVGKIINVGCHLKSVKDSLGLAKDYDFIYAAVGFHPHDAQKFDGVTFVELKNLAKEKKVIAIGEIGLDYFRDLSPRPAQKEVFKKMLGLAQELDLPVILHCRDAYDDILGILQEYDGLRGVAHCFSGSAEYAQKFLDLGFLLSFTGSITYPKRAGAEIFKVIKNTPLEKIMIETDAPFLAPVPHRGQRNEPAFVKFVCQKIAEIKGLTFEAAAQKTAENAEGFFKI